MEQITSRSGGDYFYEFFMSLKAHKKFIEIPPPPAFDSEDMKWTTDKTLTEMNF